MRRHLDPLILFLSIVTFLVYSAGFTSAQTTFTGKTMGPIDYRVVIHDPLNDSDTAVLEQGIADRLEQVNRLMSTYIDDSDVSRINQAAANQWIEVDPLTLHVIRRSLEFSEATDGAFDITVGPAVDLWQFGPSTGKNGIPSSSEIEAVRQIVGHANIQIREQPPAVSKRHEGSEIDLSAIAKGYAVDRVADYLSEHDLRNFLVEVGGEVVTRGQKPDGRWRIGLEKPVAHQRAIEAAVELQDQALATSGDYRNFRIIDGRRYSHTIDPATCQPVRNRVAASSVLASDCLTADAVATALMVMGPERGLRFCEDRGLAAAITVRDLNGEQLTTSKTESFPELLETGLAVGVEKQKVSILPAFIGALIIFGLAITGMAVGAIFNNRPIAGSCGGIAARQNADGSSSCSLCQKPVSECPERNKT